MTKASFMFQRDVTYEEAKQFAEENGLMFVEASAKTYVYTVPLIVFNKVYIVRGIELEQSRRECVD